MAKGKKTKRLGIIIVNIVAVVLIIATIISGAIGMVLAKVLYEEEYVASAIVNVTKHDGSPYEHELEMLAESIEAKKNELESFSGIISYLAGVSEIKFSVNIEAEVIPDSTLIRISVTSPNKDEAEAFLNALIQMGPYELTQSDYDLFTLTVVDETKVTLKSDSSLAIVMTVTIVVIAIIVVVNMIINMVLIIVLVKNKKKKVASDEA